jgi:hypothetical protein
MSDSKAVKALKLQHKQELADGVTTIKKFKDWNVQAPVFSIVPENIDQKKLPTIDETLALTSAAIKVLEVVEPIVEAAIKASKASLAEAIFVKSHNSKAGLVRKDVIALFMADIDKGGAGLSKPGANTYYHNLKTKHGLVAVKAA